MSTSSCLPSIQTPAGDRLALCACTMLGSWPWDALTFPAYFVANRVALHPPKPDSIFTKLCLSVGRLCAEMFTFPETPNSSKPLVPRRVWSSVAFMLMMVSKRPAAPRVCPKYPFRASAGTSDRPALPMAMDSIWSLNRVAVPWALTKASCVLSTSCSVTSNAWYSPSAVFDGALM